MGVVRQNEQNLGILEFADGDTELTRLLDRIEAKRKEFRRNWIDPFTMIVYENDSTVQHALVAGMFFKSGRYGMEMVPFMTEDEGMELAQRDSWYYNDIRSNQQDCLKQMECWNVICDAYRVSTPEDISGVEKALIAAIATFHEI